MKLRHSLAILLMLLCMRASISPATQGADMNWKFWTWFHHSLTRSGIVTQISGGQKKMTVPANLGQIMGIVPGATGTFVVTWFQGANGTGSQDTFIKNPTWTSSDTTNAPVSVDTTSDPTGNTVKVAVPAAAPASVITLTVTGKNEVGNTITVSTPVAILGPAAKSGVLTQTS